MIQYTHIILLSGNIKCYYFSNAVFLILFQSLRIKVLKINQMVTANLFKVCNCNLIKKTYILKKK
jgi:hypothetical protein